MTSRRSCQNHGMLRHLDAAAPPDDVAAVLAADGCVVIDDLAPSELLDAFEAEIAPYRAVTPIGADDFAGFKTHRTGGLVGRSGAARSLVTHPTVLSTVKSVLGHADRVSAPSHPAHRHRTRRDSPDHSP